MEEKRDTKRIGDFAELAVMMALVDAGYRICIPFGENHRYDLIADGFGKLLRVQVKNVRCEKAPFEYRALAHIRIAAGRRAVDITARSMRSGFTVRNALKSILSRWKRFRCSSVFNYGSNRREMDK